MKRNSLIVALIVIPITVLIAQVPTDGLVAEWLFEDNLSDTKPSGTQYNLNIIQGESSYLSGKVGNALYLNGATKINNTNQNLVTIINNKNPWTISFWFRYQSGLIPYKMGAKHLISIDQNPHAPPYKRIWISTGGVIGCQMENDNYGTNVNVLSNHNIDDDKWYHATIIHDGTTMSMYVNNVLQQEVLSINLGTEPLEAFVIGSCSQSDWQTRDFYDGLIDQLRVYNRALSSTEIGAIYSIENPSETVSDFDGNTYNTVTIGNQTWMAENLKTTTYNDGTPIPNVTDGATWIALTSPAYCWYNNDESTYKDAYGALYNWYTVETENLCPSGWHVPTKDEWTTLSNYLIDNNFGFEGSGIDIGKSLATSSGWDSNATAGNVGNDLSTNNSSEFSSLPSGYRDGGVGAFYYVGWYTGFYCSTSQNDELSYNRSLYSNSGEFYENNADKQHGHAVRCLKNSEHAITVNNVTVNEGQQVIIPISVSNLTAEDNIIAYQFDIDYDNATLEYTTADLTGTLAEGGTLEVNSSVAGKLSISYMNSSALVGAGEILNLQFNSLKADTTEATISNAYLNSSPITDLTNGTVIVKDITPPTARIYNEDTEIRCADLLTISAIFDEPMLEANAVKLSLSGAATLTETDMIRMNDTVYTYTYQIPKSDGVVTVSLGNGTDMWGNVVVSTPTSGETFSIIPITYGDVDDDGTIFAYDAALTLQYSVGLDPLPTIDPLPWENWRDTTANVDMVGVVTANDAILILQYSVGIITSFDADAKKSASVADVMVEVVDGEIVFYSSGDLIGLNVSAINENNILSEPVIVAENFLSAKNIEGTTYKIGLCTSTPAFEGDDLIKIPFNHNGSVTFDLVVNTELKSVTVDLATGIGEFGESDISIYPNPADELLTISGLTTPTVVRLFSVNGKQIMTRNLVGISEEIDVSELPEGMYILELETKERTDLRKIAIK